MLLEVNRHRDLAGMDTMDIDVLRQQHALLLEIAGKLNDLLDQASMKQRADKAQECLEKLAAELEGHLFCEDDMLYPALMKSKDAEIVKTTKRLSSDMGGLKDAFNAYKRKWTVEQIEKDGSGFIMQSIEIISALSERINKEEKILFPLLER